MSNCQCSIKDTTNCHSIRCRINRFENMFALLQFWNSHFELVIINQKEKISTLPNLSCFNYSLNKMCISHHYFYNRRYFCHLLFKNWITASWKWAWLKTKCPKNNCFDKIRHWVLGSKDANVDLSMCRHSKLQKESELIFL